MEAPVPTAPVVYEYLSYRKFLGDMIEYLRATGRYSNRKFAEQIGIKSPSFLRMVVAGERTINKELTWKLAEVFELKEKEATFFELLVDFDQAKTPRETDEAYKKILSSKQFRLVRTLAGAEYDFFSTWYIVAMLEAINSDLGQFPEEKMARVMGIKKSEVDHTLEVLQKLDLIERKENRWVRKERQLETALDLQSLNIRNFHRELGKKGIEALDNLQSDKRTFTGMTIMLSPETYQEFRKKIFAFLQEANAIYSEQEKSKTIYHLNMQLFPLFSLPESTDEP